MAVKGYADNIFVNCPFDDDYYELLYAVVFTVHDCGFVARCALEDEDGGDVRIQKIQRIIRECKYGIHDVSRTELSKGNRLPRFNMPLELGLFLGARCFGDSGQKRKKCLVLDREPYRYQQFISDIAGQDIRAHAGDDKKLVSEVRGWLRNVSGRKNLPGGAKIWERYCEFWNDLPDLCPLRQDSCPLPIGRLLESAGSGQREQEWPTHLNDGMQF